MVISFNAPHTLNSLHNGPEVQTQNQKAEVYTYRFTMLNQGWFGAVFTILVLKSFTVFNVHGQMTTGFEGNL